MAPDHDTARPLPAHPLPVHPLATQSLATQSLATQPPAALAPAPGADAGLTTHEHRALRVLAGFAETALPAMLLLYLAANERSADTLPELKQVIDTLSEVPVRLDGQGAEPIHTAVGRLYSMVGALRGRIG